MKTHHRAERREENVPHIHHRQVQGWHEKGVAILERPDRCFRHEYEDNKPKQRAGSACPHPRLKEMRMRWDDIRLLDRIFEFRGRALVAEISEEPQIFPVPGILGP